MKYQKIISIVFLCVIFICGILTLVMNPVKIAGGFARGYLNTSEANILQKIGNGFIEFENRINTYFVLHDQAVNMHGLTQKFLTKDLVEDTDKSSEVVKLKNGYLIFKDTSDTDLSSLEKAIYDLNNICINKDIDLMYVNKISKHTTDANLLPDNYPYIYDDNTDDVLKRLENNGITVLNLETCIEDENIDKYSLFFKTDHHWTPKAGVWVSKKITDAINQNYDNYNFSNVKYNMEEYNIETFENSFLGSEGKRVGKYYSGVDNFDVVTPKVGGEYKLQIKNENVCLEGTFEDVFIHKEHITPDDLLNEDTTAYQVYMNGNHPLVEIENKSDKNGKKALVVLDSYGCVVAPYLSQSFAEVDCIDLRSFSQSLQDYIVETKPDIVIYMATNYQ